MNLTSTAKAPPVARFQAWGDSPNAYPVNEPKIDKEALALSSPSLLLGAFDDLRNAQFQNRTTSLANKDVYELGGFVLVGTAGNVDLPSRYVPSVGFGNFEMAVSQPTVVDMLVVSGDNTTFNLPAISAPFGQDLAELREMVLAISQGVAFHRSAEFEGLLDRALAKRGTPRDVENWARRLAENVLDLDD
jgi:hypothetical protein